MNALLAVPLLPDDAELVISFTVPGEPVPKARPRVVRGHGQKRGYTPERTAVAETAVGWRFRQAVKGHGVDADSSFGVIAVFCRQTRIRCDVDNLLKTVLDGLNGVAWRDDWQVVDVAGRKRLVDGNPRTEITIYRAAVRQ